MKVIVFTKLLQPWNAGKLIEFAKANGLAGFDLTVRPGFPVQPEDITRTLPPFVRQIKAAGLEVPMATVGGTAMPAADKLTETCWAACAEAGIKAIKLGYWNWKPTGGAEHYWEKVKAIRGELALYAKLGAKHGMQALCHTHSDAYYGLNASALMHLIHDLDPKHVAAYVDPAHLTLNGEPLPMALDILKGRIGMVAVKNSHYWSVPGGERTAWKRGVCPLHKGIVDWPEAIRLLRATGYDGWISIHGEYDDRHETAAALEYLVPDIAYLRRILG